MKVSLTECTVKTGGETYAWAEQDNGRFWDRRSKSQRKWYRIKDAKLIDKLNHAVDAREEARETKRHEHWLAEERKHAKQQSGGVRIYSEDGKSYLNVEVSAPNEKGIVNLHLIVGGRFHYNYPLDVPEFEVLHEEVSKGRPAD